MPKPVWSMGRIWRTFPKSRWMIFWVTIQKSSSPGPPHSRNLSLWKAARDRYCAHIQERARVCFERILVSESQRSLRPRDEQLCWKCGLQMNFEKEIQLNLSSKLSQIISANTKKLVILLTNVLRFRYPYGTGSRWLMPSKRRRFFHNTTGVPVC